MSRIRKAGLGGGLLWNLRGLLLILIQAWFSTGLAHGDTSLVAWGNVGMPVPAIATNISHISASEYGNAVYQKDGSIVVFPFFASERAVVWDSNVLALQISETSVHEITHNHIVNLSNGIPLLSNVVAINPYLFLKGDGTVSEFNGPSDLGYSNVAAISSGPLIKSDGTIIQPSTNFPFTPPPPGLTNVVQTGGDTEGYAFFLALRRDGTVIGWGGLTNQPITTIPPGLTNVVNIALGYDFAVALKNDGTVVAWGGNELGQTNVPPGLTNVTEISVDSDYVLAVVDTDFPNGNKVKVSSSITSSNTFTATVPSISGKVYSLEYTTTLNPPNWTFLPLVAGTGDALTLVDTNLTDAQRFYRVRRW